MIGTSQQQIVLLLLSPGQNDIWSNKQNIMKKLILIPILIVATKNIYSQNQANNKTMKTAKELLQAYHSSIQNPDAAASLFATDGAVEPPIWLHSASPGGLKGRKILKT